MVSANFHYKTRIIISDMIEQHMDVDVMRDWLHEEKYPYVVEWSSFNFSKEPIPSIYFKFQIQAHMEYFNRRLKDHNWQ